MKKLSTLYFIVFIVSISCSYGQVEKGNFLIGGSGSLNTTNSKVSNSSISKTTTVTLAPNLGYFVSNSLALGLRLPLTYIYYQSGYGLTVQLSPFIRYYFSTKEKSSIFIPFSIGVANSTYHNSGSNGNNTSYSSTTGSLGIGYAYFITPTIGLETSLSYYLQNTKNNILAVSSTNSRGLNLQIGFQIYLSREK